MSARVEKTDRGHTLIEVVLVVALLAILAGLAFFGVHRSIELYTRATRDYLEVYGESKIALERISREIREAAPGNVAVDNQAITVTKRSGHGTEEDDSPVVTFYLDGGILRRSSGAGSFPLVDHVSGFEPSRDEETGVVTIDLTLARGDNSIRLRTAAGPRQKPAPDPTPEPGD